MTCDVTFEFLEFPVSWQFPLDQKITDLNKSGMLRQLLDGIASIPQYSYFAIKKSDVAGAVAVTNLEYEATLQEKKRQIKVLQPEFVEQFISEFKRLLKKQQSL